MSKRRIQILLIIMVGFSNLTICQNTQSYDSYKNELDLILESDQKIREGNDIKKQIEVDSLNRSKLDNLHEKYGFPSLDKVGKQRLMTTILLLHHSEDCKWNKKWIRIFLDHYEEVSTFKTLMTYMFERTYGDELGVCKSTEFIENLKSEYPSEIIELFGIDKL